MTAPSFSPSFPYNAAIAEVFAACDAAAKEAGERRHVLLEHAVGTMAIAATQAVDGWTSIYSSGDGLRTAEHAGASEGERKLIERFHSMPPSLGRFTDDMVGGKLAVYAYVGDPDKPGEHENLLYYYRSSDGTLLAYGDLNSVLVWKDNV